MAETKPEVKVKPGDVVKLKTGDGPSMVVLYSFFVKPDNVNQQVSMVKCA